MTIKNEVLTIGTARKSLLEDVPDAQGGRRTRSILVQVPDAAAASVFIGGPTVTTSDGIEVKAGGDLSLDLDDDEVYAVASQNVTGVRVMHTGV